MKRKKRKDLAPLCAEIGLEDGTNPKEFFQVRSKKKKNYKAQQVGKAVTRAIDYVLISVVSNPLLQDLSVLYVEPAPNSSHFLVVLSPNSFSETWSEKETMAALAQLAPRFKEEIGASMHRKRVPELSFCILPHETA